MVKVGSQMIDSSLKTKLDCDEDRHERGRIMDIKAAEISAILKDQIKNFGQEAEVSEVGQVLSRRRRYRPRLWPRQRAGR